MDLEINQKKHQIMKKEISQNINQKMKRKWKMIPNGK